MIENNSVIIPPGVYTASNLAAAPIPNQYQPVNPTVLSSQPMITTTQPATIYTTPGQQSATLPSRSIEETFNSLEHLPRMKDCISLEKMHQFELLSSDDENTRRTHECRGCNNTTNINQFHFLQAQLSRKYEDSKVLKILIHRQLFLTKIWFKLNFIWDINLK